MYILHVSTGVFILMQIFTNMYKLLLTNTTIKSPEMNLPCVLRQGWYYCHTCQLNAPPRSHHCPICEICVLKRDHHCIFTGNCVGHFNHRYFVNMIIYLWIGCAYVVLFNLDYYNQVLGSFNIYLLAKLFCPMLAWTLGYVTAYQLYILIVGGVNLLAMLLFTFLVGFQCFFISRGQTQFECKKKVNSYSINLLDNWKAVLGERWFMTPLSAYLSSPLPSDGTDFKEIFIEMEVVKETSKTM